MRDFVTCLVLSLAMQVPGAVADPRFIDRAADQSFTHSYTGGWEHFVGGGLAAFDCNEDGFPEIFAAGGETPSALLINETERSGAPLRFAPSAAAELAMTGVTGAYPLDIDGDAVMDLVVLRVGENRLYRGLGDCWFERANELWNFDGRDRWTTAFSATWENGEKFPTLVFGDYVDRDDPEGPFSACDDNWLYRPAGEGYGPSQKLEPGHCTLSMLFSDWGRNGQADLRISNDRHYYVRGGQEQLWRMSAVPELYDEADGWAPLSIWGMGIASRDIDGDGLPEVFLTSMGDQKLRMLIEGGAAPTYRDTSFDHGTTAHVPYVGDEGRPSSGWHADFGDVDNDGLDDLFIAKGNVEQMPDAAMRDPNNLLMQVNPGKFVEFGDEAGLATTERARGAAVVDLNRDGRLDIVVNNRRAGLELNENVTTETGHWLAVELRLTGVNSRAVGSWIEVTDGERTWHREVTVGGGHAGGTMGFYHFGTGGAGALRLRMLWWDGPVSDWHQVDADQHVRIEREGRTVRIVPQVMTAVK